MRLSQSFLKPSGYLLFLTHVCVVMSMASTMEPSFSVRFSTSALDSTVVANMASSESVGLVEENSMSATVPALDLHATSTPLCNVFHQMAVGRNQLAVTGGAEPLPTDDCMPSSFWSQVRAEASNRVEVPIETLDESEPVVLAQGIPEPPPMFLVGAMLVLAGLYRVHQSRRRATPLATSPDSHS